MLSLAVFEIKGGILGECMDKLPGARFINLNFKHCLLRHYVWKMLSLVMCYVLLGASFS